MTLGSARHTMQRLLADKRGLLLAAGGACCSNYAKKTSAGQEAWLFGLPGLPSVTSKHECCSKLQFSAPSASWRLVPYHKLCSNQPSQFHCLPYLNFCLAIR